MLKKWLYGHYVHEKQHAQDLRDLGIGQPIHRMNFVLAITDLIKICSWIANNAKVVLGVS